MKNYFIYIIVKTYQMQRDNLHDKLNELKNTYYQNNTKNTFFKNKQKLDCADMISNSIDINTLMHNTFFQFENTNKLFFQYTVFKTFATDNNINHILNCFMNLLEEIINNYGSFELHINMETYTITAHERYKNMYKLLFSRCKENNILFSSKLVSMNIYNTPNIINTLQSFFAPFIDKNAVNKIFIIDKKQSKSLLEKLFANNNIKGFY